MSHAMERFGDRTPSGDTMMQYRNRGFASPRKWLNMDIECQGGCGLVPFRYRDRNFVNALQWAIGLELFLLVDDPWRVFLTTDHPNGAPFTSYPHLIRLLMDRGFRNDRLAAINRHAAAASTLAIITFLNSWNYLLWPLIVAQDQGTYTLPVGLAVASQAARSTDYGLLLAGAIVVLMPVLILFLFLQRYFVRGVALTGFK